MTDGTTEILAEAGSAEDLTIEEAQPEKITVRRMAAST
jgi:hypothetical protein